MKNSRLEGEPYVTYQFIFFIDYGNDWHMFKKKYRRSMSDQHEYYEFLYNKDRGLHRSNLINEMGWKGGYFQNEQKAIDWFAKYNPEHNLSFEEFLKEE